MEKNKTTISSIPAEERPYEKCVASGPEVLTDSELLAVILRTGVRGMSAIDLSRAVLELHGSGLIGLYHLTTETLMQVPGIGKVKAVQLLCIAELTKRMSRQKISGETISFTSPEDVASYYMETMRHKEKEEVVALFLNTKGVLIRESKISVGTVNQSVCSPREIFAEALKVSAVSMIMIHNHPSGDPEPSPEDIEVTRRIEEAGEMLGIAVLDHLIIGDHCYTSLKERGLL